MNLPGAPLLRYCPATVLLVGLTTGTYLLQVLLGGEAVQRAVGLVPADVSRPSTLFAVGERQVVPAWLTLLTYVFPHWAWWHVAMNMLGLWCLGRLAEPVMGTRKFLLAYFASGVVCGMSIVLLVPSWTKPTAGASGAIAGVLGGFLAMRWSRPLRWGIPLLVVELFSVFGVVLWLLLRTTPTELDRPSALLWHLIPFLAGWLYIRWCRGLPVSEHS